METFMRREKKWFSVKVRGILPIVEQYVVWKMLSPLTRLLHGLHRITVTLPYPFPRRIYAILRKKRRFPN